MRIVRFSIERFRSIRSAIVFPEVHNVYLGPNNIGKTAILEALNLLLNPEVGSRGNVVDENDFYCRQYRLSGSSEVPPSRPLDDADASSEDGLSSVEGVISNAGEDQSSTMEAPSLENEGDIQQPVVDGMEPPILRVEAVLTGLDSEDITEFSSFLVPWDDQRRIVIEATGEGIDPFAEAFPAVRPCFEAWYDEEEDDFAWRSFFRTDPQLSRDESPAFTKQHKRRIGFLIYRDFRALQRPITLEPYALFGRLLQSQQATPKQFEAVLDELQGAVEPLFREAEFGRVVNEYRQELLRYLPLANIGEARLTFEATDRSREQVKAAAQLYVEDEIPLPLQKMGAGTRSLAILAVLLLIARKRGRGIVALEEPETFLFPHAQRRVIDEVLALSSQTFITTHSPYVLERIPVESFQRLLRDKSATVSTSPLVTDPVTARQVRERFRKQLSEALLGRGAIVVEEESTRLWILKTSALMHGTEFDGIHVDALELQGVSVVTALGNGDVPSVGSILRRAGLWVIGFLDQVTEEELRQYHDKDAGLSFLFHSERGLEDLLLRDLPRPIIRNILINAPYTKYHYDAVEVDGWSEHEFNLKARDFLKRHKGYQPFHEWILDQISPLTVPVTFKRLIAFVTEAMSGNAGVVTCSLIPR